MMRSRAAVIFLILGLIFASFSLMVSGAIQQAAVGRSIIANTALDTNAILKLDGFNNTAYTVSNINKKYFKVGDIVNNSNRTINLTVEMQVDFSKQTNKTYWMGIKIDAVTTEFSFGSATAKRAVIILSPGQMVSVQAALTNNQAREVGVSYNFYATDTTGDLSIQVSDTPFKLRYMTFR